MSVKLTDAQLVMMSAAAQRKDRCLSAPATIKGAALSKVSAKLAKLGLAREIARRDRARRGVGAAGEEWRQFGRRRSPGPGGRPARRQQAGAGDRPSTATARPKRPIKRADRSMGARRRMAPLQTVHRARRRLLWPGPCHFFDS